jgi:hypothetical protein
VRSNLKEGYPEDKKMKQIRISRTNAGKGLKVMINNEWYYASITKIEKALSTVGGFIDFNTIDPIN